MIRYLVVKNFISYHDDYEKMGSSSISVLIIDGVANEESH